MKYRELPSLDAITRLTSYAFVRDGADESVYKFYKGFLIAFEYFSNQREKLLKKYGEKQPNGNFIISETNKSKCFEDFNSLLDSDVNFDIYPLDITEQDFDPQYCRKPSEINLVLSAVEKRAILNVSESTSQDNQQ